jgi:hypothetical protein
VGLIQPQNIINRYHAPRNASANGKQMAPTNSKLGTLRILWRVTKKNIMRPRTSLWGVQSLALTPTHS